MMGAEACFKLEEIQTVSEALDIAEDRIAGLYKFSLGQWKRHRYGVKTLRELISEEIAPEPAFALLTKYSAENQAVEPRQRNKDFYSICLQDHRILRALDRDQRLSLLPLMVYIFAHELIHIVRFCNFYQRFEVAGEGRRREEAIVHAMTLDALSGLQMPNLDYILASYRAYMVCDLAVFQGV